MRTNVLVRILCALLASKLLCFRKTYQLHRKVWVIRKRMPNVVAKRHEVLEIGSLVEVVNEWREAGRGCMQARDSLDFKVTLSRSRAHGQLRQNVQLLDVYL